MVSKRGQRVPIKLCLFSFRHKPQRLCQKREQQFSDRAVDTRDSGCSEGSLIPGTCLKEANGLSCAPDIRRIRFEIYIFTVNSKTIHQQDIGGMLLYTYWDFCRLVCLCGHVP